MMRNQKKTVCARVSTQTCVWEKEKMLETKTRPGKNENKFSFVWHKRAQWLIFSFAFSLYVRLFLKCFHIGWKKMLIYGASNENLYIYTMCELWLLFVVCDFFFLRVCGCMCFLSLFLLMLATLLLFNQITHRTNSINFSSRSIERKKQRIIFDGIFLFPFSPHIHICATCAVVVKFKVCTCKCLCIEQASEKFIFGLQWFFDGKKSSLVRFDLPLSFFLKLL